MTSRNIEQPPFFFIILSSQTRDRYLGRLTLCATRRSSLGTDVRSLLRDRSRARARATVERGPRRRRRGSRFNLHSHQRHGGESNLYLARAMQEQRRGRTAHGIE